MSITHHDSRLLAVVFAFQLIAASLFGATTNWYQGIKDLKVGSPEAVVRETMDRYKQENWQAFSNRYSNYAQCLGGERSSIWVVDVDARWASGTEDHFYIIAVFSEAKKLSDLLRFSLPIGFTPLVEGEYAQRLESIEVGMKVDDIYRLLGVKPPTRYYRDESDRWKVGFSYSRSLSGVVQYQADAATGLITETSQMQ